jgi:putative chitinase
MTDYIVVANKLNFRAAPRSGDVIAVLPRGHSVSGGPVAGDEEWLQVTALLPQGTADAGGFVAADFVEPEDGAAPKPKAGAPAGPTLAQMRKLAPTGKDLILQAVVDEFPTTGATFGLTKSKLIMCHFLAQACHESAHFRTTREFWGPTKAQRGYEGRKDLGNNRPGDGKRYMGRGIFQLTGRANYRSLGAKLGLDLEGNPDLAAEPRISFRIACHYWAGRGIEKWAAANDIVKVTKLINGGTNGLPDRQALFARAMKIF